MGIFGGGGGGGLFGHPAPAPSEYGNPRGPFARVFDPEAQRTTLTGFLGRVAGNPTQGERAGEAMGSVMQKWGQLRMEGLPPNQAFIQLTQDPSFMEAFIQSPDAGRLVNEILRGSMDFDAASAAPDPMNIAPGGAVYQPGQGEVYRNPTEKNQSFMGFAEMAQLPPERFRELAEAQLIDETNGDTTQTERATDALVQLGLISNSTRLDINAGLITLRQKRNNDGTPIDEWEAVNMRTGQAYASGGAGSTDPNAPVMSGTSTPDAGAAPPGQKVSPGAFGGNSGGDMSGGGPTVQTPYTASVADAPAEVQGLYTMAGERYGVPPDLLAAMGKAESGWRVNARSPAGSLGIAQFMPATAREYGVDPMNPASAIDGQARYIRKYLNKYGGDSAAALVAYNAGEKVADAYVKCGRCVSALPGETRGYLAKVLGGSTGASYVEAVSGVAPKSQRFPSMRPWRGGQSTDMLMGDPASDDLLEDAPGAGKEPLPLGMTELSSGEMTGPEAALGSGTFQSIGEFMGDVMGEMFENPDMVPQTVRDRREYLRNLRENVVRYADASGREAAQEGQRVMDLAPKLGLWTNPVKALSQMIALRREVARQTKADWAIAENIDPRTGKPGTTTISGQAKPLYSETQREDATVRATAGETLLRQIGDESELMGAMERAKKVQGTSRWSFLVDILRGAESDMEQVLGDGSRGTNEGMDPEQFGAIMEAMTSGREPSDELLRQMSTDQQNQLVKIWESQQGKAK